MLEILKCDVAVVAIEGTKKIIYIHLINDNKNQKRKGVPQS